jgi:hypothetical protein
MEKITRRNSMKYSKHLLLVSLTAVLAACVGGGGSGGTSGSVDVQEQNNNEPELKIDFSSTKTEPKVFNPRAFGSAEKNHFDPEDVIQMQYNISIYYTTNSEVDDADEGQQLLNELLEADTADGPILFDTTVYLSSDRSVDGDSLKLFSTECGYPVSQQHACGEDSSFYCTYAEDNQNTLNCLSTPTDREKSFENLIIDTTPFLTTIPKTANVIYQACLREEPEKCVESVLPIQLN